VTNSPSNFADVLEREPELAIILCQPPVAFNRSFIDITGSATSALYLSASLEMESESAQCGTWFNISAEQLQSRSGLNEREQRSAMKRLRELNLVQERRQQRGTQTQIRINYDCIFQGLVTLARRQSSVEACPAWSMH